MNTQEHLLVCTVEEGVEIAEEANTISRNLSKVGTKCLRFGMDDRNVLDPTGPTNCERLIAELIDLFALTEMMVEAGMIPAMWLDPAKVEAKKEKVRKFMEHARKGGALSPETGQTEIQPPVTENQPTRRCWSTEYPIIKKLEYDTYDLVAHPNGPALCDGDCMSSIDTHPDDTRQIMMLKMKAQAAWLEYAWPLVKGNFYPSKQQVGQ